MIATTLPPTPSPSGAGDDENLNDLVSGNRGISEAVRGAGPRRGAQRQPSCSGRRPALLQIAPRALQPPQCRTLALAPPGVGTLSVHPCHTVHPAARSPPPAASCRCCAATHHPSPHIHSPTHHSHTEHTTHTDLCHARAAGQEPQQPRPAMGRPAHRTGVPAGVCVVCKMCMTCVMCVFMFIGEGMGAARGGPAHRAGVPAG